MISYLHASVRLVDFTEGDFAGEHSSCLGVDIQAARPAPSLERARVDYGANGDHALGFLRALDALRFLQPLVIGAGEQACILHDRENAAVILSIVPRDADCTHLADHCEFPIGSFWPSDGERSRAGAQACPAPASSPARLGPSSQRGTCAPASSPGRLSSNERAKPADNLGSFT